jgi:TonB family protein
VGAISLNLFWLPVSIWTFAALIGYLFFRLREDNISTVYHYYSRTTLLWGLAAGVFGSLVFYFLPSTSTGDSGVTANIFIIQYPLSTVSTSDASSIFWSNPDFWIGILTIVAGLLALIALLKLSIEWMSLHFFTSGLRESEPGLIANLSEKNKQLLKNINREMRIAFSNKIAVPCTFGWRRRRIVLPDYLRSDSQKLNMAVRHELTHIKNHDFLVNITIRMIRGLFFFHPLVHVFNKEIETYREIYCDQQVLRDSDISPKNYAQLLFELVASKSAFETTAAVNMAVHPSTLKKRIQMMKNSTQPSRSLKWSLSIMLVFALAISGLMACSDINSDNGITQSDVQKTQAQMSATRSDGSPLFVVDGKKITTAKQRVKVSRIKPKYIKSIAVLKDSTAIKAYGQAGKNGVVKIRLIDKKKAFNDLLDHAPDSTDWMNPHKKKIFVAVAKMPRLKGGYAEFQKKVTYPKSCYDAGIEGRVSVQFVVNKKGMPTNVHVVNGIGGGCDQAAMDAVKKYARFTPGKQRGKPVNVKMSLPIVYKLSRKDSSKQSTKAERGHIVGKDMEIQNLTMKNGKYSGTLYSKKTGNPLPGANITILNPKTGKTTSTGTASDKNGNFTLDISRIKISPMMIKIQYTGYKPMNLVKPSTPPPTSKSK